MTPTQPLREHPLTPGVSRQTFHVSYCFYIHRGDSRLAPSQWQTALQSNSVSHSVIDSYFQQWVLLMLFMKFPWWRHQMETFSALLALCAGNSPVPVDSPHKGQWRGALMFSLIYAWINDWVNNREAGDLRRQRGHCDVIVMQWAPAVHSCLKMFNVMGPRTQKDAGLVLVNITALIGWAQT